MRLYFARSKYGCGTNHYYLIRRNSICIRSFPADHCAHSTYGRDTDLLSIAICQQERTDVLKSVKKKFKKKFNMEIKITEDLKELRSTTLCPADIKLYPLTPMDYFSMTQTPLSKSQTFRAELWRRRHRQTNGGHTTSIVAANGKTDAKNGVHASNGGGESRRNKDGVPAVSNGTTEHVDIESVLTRNMRQRDLKGLIDHQMIEALKLMRMFTERSGGGLDTLDELEEMAMLNASRTSLNITVRKSPPSPTTRTSKRPKASKIVKAKNQRRITL